MKMYFMKNAFKLYRGDKINHDDIECMSAPPSKYHTPIFSGRKHIGWEITVSGQQSQQDDMLNSFRDAIQERLDTKPKERGYDGILSLCTYVTDPIPRFAAEGQAGVNWRGTAWATAYEILDSVLRGEREIPTIEELLSELPVMLWPDEIIEEPTEIIEEPIVEE